LAGPVEYAQAQDAALQSVSGGLLACIVNPRLGLA